MPCDGRNAQAVQIGESLGPNEQILTSNLVVGETWTVLRRQDRHRTAVEFLERVDLIDATSFRIMRDRRMREAFAFDQEFEAAGFIEVRV